jgi:hypothetical protein
MPLIDWGSCIDNTKCVITLRASAPTDKYGAIAIGFNVETVQVNERRCTSTGTLADISPVQKY